MDHTEERALTTDIYNGADPMTVPLYSIGEVAHHLRIPPSTVRAWVKSRGGSAPFRRVIVPDDDGSGSRLSFRNLVEVHVLSSIRGERIPLPKVREAIGLLRQWHDTDHPLADVQLHADATDLFVRHLDAFLAVTRGGQAAIGPVVDRYMKRIERDEAGLLERLYPFVDGDDRIVAIDPRRRFGKPYLVGAGVETSAVLSRYRAGDSIAALARDFDTTEDEIKGALRFESALQEAA